jgi:hypothetical protein
MMRWAWLLAPALLAACDGNRALVVSSAGGAGPSAPMNGGGGTFKDSADASATPVTTVVAPSPDAAVEAGAVAVAEAGVAAAEAGVVSSPVPSSCDELAAGGAPDQLVDFTWQQQTGTCSGSACWTYVYIQMGCTLSVQRDNVIENFKLGPADCAAARGWATNARFLDVLRNGTGCADGTNPESFELTLTGDAPRRKTWGCDEPVVDLERKCFGALAERFYPPRANPN